MEVGIVLFTFLVSAVTSLLVYHKNPRSGTNVYLSLLVLCIGMYPSFNYLAIHSTTSSQALFWAKAILLVSIPQGTLLYFFARTFPGSRFIFNRRLQIFLGLWVLLDCVLAVSGLIFEAVSVKDGTVSISPGPLVPLFGLLHAGTIIAGITVLYRKYRKAIDKEKEQLTYIFFGILISFSLTFMITLVLPLVLKNTLLLAVSPLFLTLSVVAVAYAIISQRLFDIRYVVIRSSAYTITRILMTLIYIVPVMLLVAEIMNVHTSSSMLRYALVVGIVFALFYDLAHNSFDTLTNKLFFRRYYEPQEVLNRLSELLVVTNDVESLKRKSSQLLQSAIRTRHFTYWIVGEASEYEIGLLEKLFVNHRDENVVILDDYDETNAAVEQLREQDVAVVVRLRTNKKNLGYITLGYMESGEIYRDRDKRMLRIAADEIAISLQNSLHFEEIQQFNLTLQQRVDAATRKLRATNEKLRKLDESKDEFISMASHQLRTPLTSVKGYLSMVLEGDVGKLNPQQKKLLNQSYMSSQRMVFLISDLLNLSRLNTGKFIIERTPVGLDEIVQLEIDQLRETAKAREVHLVYEKPPKFPKLMLDETKTHQVVMNLLDNAIYYTRPGGTVTIELNETPTSVEYLVKDNGIGVPRAEQHHLFSKFYRANNAKQARPDGTGLGLFMAKKVIAAQGGVIVFESEEGKGSTFGFRFEKRTYSYAVPSGQKHH